MVEKNKKKESGQIRKIRFLFVVSSLAGPVMSKEINRGTITCMALQEENIAAILTINKIAAKVTASWLPENYDLADLALQFVQFAVDEMLGEKRSRIPAWLPEEFIINNFNIEGRLW